MERDDAKKTPKIRYLSRREMLSLMGSTAVAVTLAGCGGGGEQPGSGARWADQQAHRAPSGQPGQQQRRLLPAW